MRCRWQVRGRPRTAASSIQLRPGAPPSPPARPSPKMGEGRSCIQSCRGLPDRALCARGAALQAQFDACGGGERAAERLAEGLGAVVVVLARQHARVEG